MFLIIKINAKVLTPLQTNTNPTKTADEKTRELLCLLPQKITENLLQNKRKGLLPTKNHQTSTHRQTEQNIVVSVQKRQLEIKIKCHMEYAEK